MLLHPALAIGASLLALGSGDLDLARFPVLPEPATLPVAYDWLVDEVPVRAGVYRSADGAELVLDNGLLRRTFRVEPNGASVGLLDLTSGQAVLRAVKPEARVMLDGLAFDVGGLVGQRDHAWIDAGQLADMTADPGALRLVDVAALPVVERLAWKRVRHHAPDAVWPPAGVGLRLSFAMPELSFEDAVAHATDSGFGWTRLVADDLADLDGWQVHGDVRAGGTLVAAGNTAAFVERALPPATTLVEVRLDKGSDRGASWGPGLALVFSDRTLKVNLRSSGDAYDAAAPSLGFFDGEREDPRAGGRRELDVARPWSLRLRRAGGSWVAEARPDGEVWREVGRAACDAAPLRVRLGKLDARGGGTDFAEPGALGTCRLLGFAAYGAPDAATRAAAMARLAALADVRVEVRYELYDGVPVLAKWLEVVNGSDHVVRVDGLTSDLLAAVERDSIVETRSEPLPAPRALHVETEYTMGGLSYANSRSHGVRWLRDPEYATQVNYLRNMPCLLEVGPERSVLRDVAPGARFESFRSFVVALDGEDRTRNALAVGRFYRTVAPWSTENPLMMHVRFADEETVKAAIDQCVEVGFELVILTFGSGFDMEDERPETLARWRRLADYGRERGIEVGGYSLLSSRRIQPDGDNCINPATGKPGGQIHGGTPALASGWGQTYLAKLRAFFEATGFMLLEHDGPYPGNLDAAARPPLQYGVEDSRYVQWSLSADLYRWLRARGVYVNAPDWYFLVGTSKCGMGYREVNWSLPRAQQVLHTRQNIFDGTRTKLPSMGWMFVPLTQYHGGGEAATVEPLDEHLDHYEAMLVSNLGAGVQACYRGPRLYDTERTKDVVARQVAWFKAHRDILESPIVHAASRRADGRDLDWLLHANPRLATRGMLVVFNPLERAVERTLRLDLYYTGARDRVRLRQADGVAREVALADGRWAEVRVAVPAGGATWIAIE